MTRKPFLSLVFAGALLLSTALAQSLPALTPPGAAGGVYTRNLAIKQAFFINFQAEWRRLGLSDLFKQMLEQDGELTADDLQLAGEVLNIDLVGREGLLVVYPSGDVFALARPSAERVDTFIALLNKSMENPTTRNGWVLERMDDGMEGMSGYIGHNGELVLMGTEGAVERFLAGERGLELPIEGDVVAWIEGEPLWPLLEDPALGLPPRVVDSIKTFGSYAFGMTIEADGLHTATRVGFEPQYDPDLAALFLTDETAWPIDELPRGLSAYSGVFDLAAFGDYVTRYASELGQDFVLDLSAFGSHFALVDAGAASPEEALQNPTGNLLFVLETRDPLTAEVTLLTWFQMLAGFATPEGTGGFQVNEVDMGGLPGKEISVGMLGTFYLVSDGNRLYLATSERAADLIGGPTFAEDPDYRRLAETYLPDAASGLSYGNDRESLKQAAQMLPFMMMQTVEDPEVQAMLYEFSDKFSQFLGFVADHLGASAGYQARQGNVLEGHGLLEVAW